MKRHGILALAALGSFLASGCESIWPKCQADSDCPSTHACHEGRCKTRVASSSSGGSSSSSFTSSSSAASSSSASGPGPSSASGPYCAGYDNLMLSRVESVDGGGPFQTRFCRDGDNPEYWYTLGPGEVRAGTTLNLAVLDESRTDAGVPAFNINFQLRSLEQAAFGWLVNCPPSNVVPHTCHDVATVHADQVYVVGQLAFAAHPAQFRHSATLQVTKTGACATAPVNTNHANARYLFLGFDNGAVCSTSTDYAFSFVCNQPRYAISVTPLDGTHAQTALDVRVSPSALGSVQCPHTDAGTYECALTPPPDGGVCYVDVAAALDAGAAPIALPASEYVSVVVRNIPDAGP